jgi:hypothetical protein
LNGSRSGCWLLWRVPSGYIHRDTCRLRITLTAASRERNAAAELPRSMKMAPDIVMNAPSGVYWIDRFAMIEVRFGNSLQSKP